MSSSPPTGTGTWGQNEQPTELHLGAHAVKVLASPLRSRIVTQLRRSGPLTATALAALLSTNSGATSYHLRRLESVGLVADTGEGKGKERLWRATTEQPSWTPSELADDEDATTALNWLERDYVRHFASRAEQWLDVQQDWPVEWVDHLGLNDNVVLVNLEQLRVMWAEMEQVLQKYRRGGQGNPQAKRVAVYTYAYPVDLDQSGRGRRS
jgi:DNA-binding transcriptional ArsR family regulator